MRSTSASTTARTGARLLAACALSLSIGLDGARADAVKWEADWSFTLRASKWDKVKDALTPAAAAELATAPKQLYAAARSAAIYLPAAMRAGDEGLLYIPQWFTDVAAKLVEPETPDAHTARARAAVAGLACRLAAVIGSGAGEAEVQAVAEHTVAFYERSATSDAGASLADALGWMRAALSIEGVAKETVLSAEQDLFTKVSPKATGPSLAIAKAELEYARAISLPDVAGAKSAIERAIAALRPLASGTPPTPGAGGLANEALDLAVRRKLGVRADYFMEAKESSDHLCRIGLPVGLGWSSLTGGSETASISIKKLGPGGAYVYQMDIFPYDSKKTFESPTTGTKVVGTDLKGLALQRVEVDSDNFKSVTKKREPKAVTLSSAFPPGFYIEVIGIDTNDKSVTRRSWIVRGKVHPITYNVCVIDASGGDAISPELKAVVESLVEVKAGK